MNQCTEIAVFKVAQEHIEQAIALSQAIFSEMNADGEVITSYQLLVKTDNPEELCWHLTWISAEAAKVTTQKWPTFASTKEFQGLVVKDLYYGHFVNART